MKRKAAKISLFTISIFVLIIGFISIQIYLYSNQTSDGQADTAIVLGAAVWETQLSPVFRERVNHAIDIYRNERVRKIIFMGGQGNSDELTEASAARKYAVENGIPESAILIEDESHSTYENIFYAKK